MTAGETATIHIEPPTTKVAGFLLQRKAFHLIKMQTPAIAMFVGICFYVVGDPRLSKGELVNVGKTFGMMLHFRM